MATTGTYEERDGQPIVRFERTIGHPVAAVWAAVTEPAQLEAWFPTTVQLSGLTPGAVLEFHFEDDAYPAMHGNVVAVEHERRFEFTWGPDRLAFELAPRDEGRTCRLALTVVLEGAEKASRDAAGWEQRLDMLELVAAGETPPRQASSARWRAYYEEYKRLGWPATAPIPESPSVSQ